jgi:hypothetical protein
MSTTYSSLGILWFSPDSERTVDGLWAAIGALIPAFKPNECANFFTAAADDAMSSETVFRHLPISSFSEISRFKIVASLPSLSDFQEVAH